jgi:hypothetical protein
VSAVVFAVAECVLMNSFSSFLDSIDRVADHAYEPTDDDVIRARLRTTGVQECQLSPDRKYSHLLRSGHLSHHDYSHDWLPEGGLGHLRRRRLSYAGQSECSGSNDQFLTLYH